MTYLYAASLYARYSIPAIVKIDEIGGKSPGAGETPIKTGVGVGIALPGYFIDGLSKERLALSRAGVSSSSMHRISPVLPFPGRIEDIL